MIIFRFNFKTIPNFTFFCNLSSFLVLWLSTLQLVLRRHSSNVHRSNQKVHSEEAVLDIKFLRPTFEFIKTLTSCQCYARFRVVLKRILVYGDEKYLELKLWHHWNKMIVPSFWSWKDVFQSYDLKFHGDGIQQNFGSRVRRLKGVETNVLFSSLWARKPHWVPNNHDTGARVWKWVYIYIAD